MESDQSSSSIDSLGREFYWIGCNSLLPDGEQLVIPFQVRKLGLLEEGRYSIGQHSVPYLYEIDDNELVKLELPLIVLSPDEEYFSKPPRYTVSTKGSGWTQRGTAISAPSNLLRLPEDLCAESDRDRLSSLREHSGFVGMTHTDSDDMDYDFQHLTGAAKFPPGRTIHFLTQPRAWQERDVCCLIEDATCRWFLRICKNMASSDGVEDPPDSENVEAYTPSDHIFDVYQQTSVPITEIDEWDAEHPVTKPYL